MNLPAFDPANAAIWLVAFLVSSTCHEAAHALVGYMGGDDTAHRAGQVSLNPIPHIRREPFGMVIVPLLAYVMFGYMIGWASAPYDPDWARRYPKRAGFMAAAGPLANLLLFIVAVVVMIGIRATGLLEQLGADPAMTRLADGIGEFFVVLAILNLLLFMFNLVPVPPLDGSAVLESFGGRLGAGFVGWFRELPGSGILGLFIALTVFRFLAGPVFGVVFGLLGLV